jgi:hypothetical protein
VIHVQLLLQLLNVDSFVALLLASPPLRRRRLLQHHIERACCFDCYCCFYFDAFHWFASILPPEHPPPRLLPLVPPLLPPLPLLLRPPLPHLALTFVVVAPEQCFVHCGYCFRARKDDMSVNFASLPLDNSLTLSRHPLPLDSSPTSQGNVSIAFLPFDCCSRISPTLAGNVDVSEHHKWMSCKPSPTKLCYCKNNGRHYKASYVLALTLVTISSQIVHSKIQSSYVLVRYFCNSMRVRGARE